MMRATMWSNDVVTVLFCMDNASSTRDKKESAMVGEASQHLVFFPLAQGVVCNSSKSLQANDFVVQFYGEVYRGGVFSSSFLEYKI
jgi:hypothetical protein